MKKATFVLALAICTASFTQPSFAAAYRQQETAAQEKPATDKKAQKAADKAKRVAARKAKRAQNNERLQGSGFNNGAANGTMNR